MQKLTEHVSSTLTKEGMQKLNDLCLIHDMSASRIIRCALDYIESLTTAGQAMALSDDPAKRKKK